MKPNTKPIQGKSLQNMRHMQRLKDHSDIIWGILNLNLGGLCIDKIEKIKYFNHPNKQ